MGAWTPVPAGSSVGTGDDDGVAVRVSHPALPVIGPTVTIGRIPVAGYHDFDTHFRGTLHNRVKIVHLEPEQYAISIRLVIAVADGAVMVFYFEAV